MPRIVTLFLLLISINAPAQDLTGIWRGHFQSGTQGQLLESFGIDDRYKFEAQINQDNKRFGGVTYSYKTTVFYGKAGCVGTVNPKTHKVLLQETKILELKSTGGACIMTCFLQYSKMGDEEFLEGNYTGISITDSTQCGTGRVFLRKVTTSDFYMEPFLSERKSPPLARKNTPPATRPDSDTREKKPEPAPSGKPALPPAAKPLVAEKKPPPADKTPRPEPPPPAPIRDRDEKGAGLKDDTTIEKPETVIKIAPVPQVLATRKNELVRTLLTSAKEIFIRIYDNGTIDNDTVSVYLDNKLVISRQKLTAKPLTLKISLDEKEGLHELVMVAENLGDIPPNTSLMVVNAGDEQHEVRITSTEQQNAVVVFRYQAGN